MPLTISELFNDATTREIGGIGPDQVNTIVSDLVGVQQGLNQAFPQVTDLTSLHAHIIANQLTEEIASVENANSPTGTPTAADPPARRPNGPTTQPPPTPGPAMWHVTNDVEAYAEHACVFAGMPPLCCADVTSPPLSRR